MVSTLFIFPLISEHSPRNAEEGPRTDTVVEDKSIIPMLWDVRWTWRTGRCSRGVRSSLDWEQDKDIQEWVAPELSTKGREDSHPVQKQVQRAFLAEGAYVPVLELSEHVSPLALP